MFFPQLYTITSYSLLQSTIRIREYVQEAKKQGYTSLAITDLCRRRSTANHWITS